MLYVLIALLITAADQLLKRWAVGHALLLPQMKLLPGVLGLRYVENPGASWGLLAGRTGLLLAVTGLVCAVIAVALLMELPREPLGRGSLSMVLGGALGNAIDRLLQGYVVDLFETQFMDFPVFNLADCFIVVGGILFCLYVLLSDRAERQRKQRSSEERLRRADEQARAERQSREEVLREFEDRDERPEDPDRRA